MASKCYRKPCYWTIFLHNVMLPVMVASWPRSQGFKSQLLTVFFSTKFHHKKAISILRLERTQMGSKWLKRASIDANGLKLARIILSSGIRKWFFSGPHLDGNDPSREFCKIWIGLEFSVTGLGPWLRGDLEKSKIQKRRIFFLGFFSQSERRPSGLQARWKNYYLYAQNCQIHRSFLHS